MKTITVNEDSAFSVDWERCYVTQDGRSVRVVERTTEETVVRYSIPQDWPDWSWYACDEGVRILRQERWY